VSQPLNGSIVARTSAMQAVVQQFFSRLHTSYLKAKGYKKQRHTFRRDLKGFTEHVQFQGSAWNGGDSRWRFYVNFGVQFHGLPPRDPDRDLPGTHCWTRIESIVPEAPSELTLVGEDDHLASELALHLERASDRVAQEISLLRKRYEKTSAPRLSLR
jgi:hypothetical protein